MKTFFLTGILTFFITNIMLSQKIKPEQVPSGVISAFQSKFPNVKNMKWEMEETDFEVEFEIDKIEWSVTYDPSGKLKETEYEIKVSDLPQNVRQAIETEFPKFKIKEAEHVTLADNSVFYEVEVEKDKKEYEIYISTDGKILKKSEETETDKKK